MNRSPHPLAPEVRSAALQLPQGSASLLEVRCTRPTANAVVFVCDLSDSCPSMKNEYEAVRRLVSDLPRTWPVWFYALSACQEIDPTAQHTVADLQDGVFVAADILRDRSRLETARRRGSLLRPALEAIAARRHKEGLASALIIVLTDGELLDAAPLTVPAQCRLVGVAPTQTGTPRQHWNRVLPGALLATLDDRRLDQIFQTTSNPFFGRCELSWTSSEGSPVPVRCYDASDGSWRELAQPLTECNLATGPAYLLLELPLEKASLLRITCTALRSRQRVSLPLDATTPRVDAATVQLLRDSLSRASQPVGEVLLDISSDHPEFAALWQDFTQAHNLARTRQRWVDAAGKVIAFPTAQEHQLLRHTPGPSTYQAIVCMASVPPGQSCPQNGRLLLIGLNRKARPALRWKQQQVLPFGTPLTDVEINFDRMEGRWLLRLGKQEPCELEPNGSQIIDEALLSGTQGPWCIVFSGELVS